MEPKAKIEGRWIEKYSKDNQIFYSLMTIDYDVNEKTYTLKGEAYDNEGKCHSSFKSIILNIDIKNSELLCIYESNMLEGKFEEIIGYGAITFYKDIGKWQYTRGTGYFVDAGTELHKWICSFERINDESIQKLINKKNISTPEDVENFIIKYHEIKQTRRECH
jgi:hypothetical protein